jgi:hypothetical protein
MPPESPAAARRGPGACCGTGKRLGRKGAASVAVTRCREPTIWPPAIPRPPSSFNRSIGIGWEPWLPLSPRPFALCTGRASRRRTATRGYSAHARTGIRHRRSNILRRGRHSTTPIGRGSGSRSRTGSPLLLGAVERRLRLERPVDRGWAGGMSLTSRLHLRVQLRPPCGCTARRLPVLARGASRFPE